MTLLIGESLDTEMFVRKHHTSRALNVEDTFNTTNPFVKRSLVYSGGTTRRCLRVEQLVASCKSAPRLSHREVKIRLLVEKGAPLRLIGRRIRDVKRRKKAVCSNRYHAGSTPQIRY